MKKKQLACFVLAGALTVVASSSLLCGNAIVSYEDVTDAPRGIEIYVDPPEHGKVKHYAMIEYSWTGDSQATYMQVGYTQNPTHGGYTEIQKQNGKLEYREFRVPSDNLSSTGMEYLWAKTVYVSNGTPYYSESRVYTQGYSLDNPITGSFRAGTLTSSWTSPRAISYGNGEVFFISAAYKGYYIDAYFINSTGNIDQAIYLEDAAGNRSSYGFQLSVNNGTIKIKALNGTYPLSDTSNLITNCMTIGYSVVDFADVNWDELS